MVALESMRLYPPAYMIGREAIEDCTIAGYHVPRGLTLLLSQWVVQRDPRFWDEPERFHPDRWRDGLLKRIPKGVYFPFGGGPRVCIGNTVAMFHSRGSTALITSPMSSVPSSAASIFG